MERMELIGVEIINPSVIERAKAGIADDVTGVYAEPHIFGG